MTTQPTTLESLSAGDLDHVIGGGIGSQIGSMFGEQGAKWGGVADSILGMFGGGGGLGGITNLFGGLLGGKGGAPSGGSTPQPQAAAQGG